MTGHAHPPAAERRGDFPPSPSRLPAVRRRAQSAAAGAARLPTWVQVGPLMRRNNGTVLHGQTPRLSRRARTARWPSIRICCPPTCASMPSRPTPQCPGPAADRSRPAARTGRAAAPPARPGRRAANLRRLPAPGLRHLLSSPATAHGLRPGRRAGRGARTLRPDAVRPALSAGAAAGRGGRADRQRPLLPHARRLVGHARPALHAR